MNLRTLIWLSVGISLGTWAMVWWGRSAPTVPAGGIAWSLSWEEGEARSRETGLPMLVHVTGPG